MGRTRACWRELAPIIARTHPAFSRPASRGGAKRHDAASPQVASHVAELESAIDSLRRQVRELSDELGRQQASLAQLLPKAGHEAPSASQQA